MIQKELKLIYEKNQNIASLMNNNQEFLRSAISSMHDRGLYYIDNDYYVYKGRGGLKIHETPKGVKKSICDIAKKYSLSVIIIDGIICQGDTINCTTNGTIDDVEIIKNPSSMVMGGEILAPYAVVSVFKDDVMVSKKLFIVPNDEYKKIVAMGTGNQFKSMMAQKMVMKRVANGIYSLLGVTLDRRDAKVIDDMGEAMRVDEEVKTVDSNDLKTLNSLVDESEKKDELLQWIYKTYKVEDINQLSETQIKTIVISLESKKASNDSSK